MKRKKLIDKYEEIGGIRIGRWIDEDPGYEIIRTISISNISNKANRARKYSHSRIRVFTLIVFYFFFKFKWYFGTRESLRKILDEKQKSGTILASEKEKELQFYDLIHKGSILSIEVLGPWHSHPSLNCKPSDADDREMTKMLGRTINLFGKKIYIPLRKRILLGIMVNNRMYDYLYERGKK